MVDVRVYGPLWQHVEPRLEIDLEGRPLTIAGLLTRFGIDAREVGIVTLDGRQTGLDRSIPDESRVCIFPPMSGG